MGLAGIWVKDFWKNELGSKLVFTDMVLAGTAVAVAMVLKWLSR